MFKLLPELVGEVGDKHFVLINGKTTKSFYDSAALDVYTGMFPIFNEKGEIVEYMNVMGSFCLKPNSLSEYLYRYVAHEHYGPSIMRTNHCTYFKSALVRFPSKYLLDDDVMEFVLAEEKRKLKNLHNCRVFASFFEEIRFKLYCKKILSQKLSKLKKMKQYMLENKNIDLSQD